jgi:cytochrome c-type biogenesis protein CcmH
MTPDIVSLRRQLQQLQELHATGVIDADTFEQGKQRLERQMVDQVMAGSDAAPAAVAPLAAAVQAATPRPRPSARLWALSSVFTLLVAVAGYSVYGTPAQLTADGASMAAAGGGGAAAQGAGAGPAGSAASHEITPEQIAALADRLRERLQAEPDNAEGWAMLARAYNMLGRAEDAAPAYKRAIELNGQDAGLMSDYADILAVSNERQLEGEPLKLIERALKIDPNQPKALSLAGTAAFNRKDYAGAVSYWERILANLPPDSPMLEQVRGSVDEARKLGGLPVRSAATAAIVPAAQPAPAVAKATADAATAHVSGTVTLSKGLAGKAGPDDTVFIFARAAEGPRMPLAILRKQVKDLPISFKLDDSTAMGPQMKLSNFPQVVVGARISKSGNAMPQPGDLQGMSAPVALGSGGLKIEINQAVGP